MTLPANSVFLPILDDLLSPDLRPVLQTPTADFSSAMSFAGMVGAGSIGNCRGVGFGNVMSTANGSSNIGRPTSSAKGGSVRKINFSGTSTEANRAAEKHLHEASRKIQKWWRNRCQSSGTDIGAERAKHSLRHRRTEEHILYLESEVKSLKLALAAERKLKSLHLDAIRSIWSQVQKISANSSNSNSIMTQSMPSDMLLSSTPRKSGSGREDEGGAMNMSFNGAFPIQPVQGCSSNCSKEIHLLRESMSKEIALLRDMITKLTVVKARDALESVEADAAAHADSGSVTVTQPQRPLSLNIVGMISKQETETPEITEFAGQMAKRVLEKAVEDEEEASGFNACKNCIAKEIGK